MPPITPQNQSAEPASLPPVSAQAQTPPAPQPTTTNQVAPGPQALLQAKMLIEQYKNDPYKLALAFEQLKAAYVAREFSVVPNPVED